MKTLLILTLPIILILSCGKEETPEPVPTPTTNNNNNPSPKYFTGIFGLTGSAAQHAFTLYDDSLNIIGSQVNLEFCTTPQQGLLAPGFELGRTYAIQVYDNSPALVYDASFVLSGDENNPTMNVTPNGSWNITMTFQVDWCQFNLADFKLSY